jgi:hypothetical protein
MNAWSYTSNPPIGLEGTVLSKKKAQAQVYLYHYPAGSVMSAGLVMP